MGKLNRLSNDDLANYLQQCGIYNVRQDIPFEDEATKTLWDKAVSDQRSADATMLSLREHLKMPSPRPGFYCGCCEAWHGDD